MVTLYTSLEFVACQLSTPMLTNIWRIYCCYIANFEQNCFYLYIITSMRADQWNRELKLSISLLNMNSLDNKIININIIKCNNLNILRETFYFVHLFENSRLLVAITWKYSYTPWKYLITGKIFLATFLQRILS